MNKKPNLLWFACALPVALILTYLGWIARFFAGGGWNDVFEMGVWAALIGSLAFPIGAPFAIWISPPVVSQHLGALSGIGYLVYVVLCVLGVRMRSWKLFVLLCVLLLLNVAGCHMNHTTASLPLSP